MRPTPHIWPYAESQARLGELLRLVLNGQEQFVTLPDGEVVAVWRVCETSRDAEGKPFVSAMATFRNVPRDEEFKLERLQDTVGESVLSLYEDAPQDEDFNPERLRGTLRDSDL